MGHCNHHWHKKGREQNPNTKLAPCGQTYAPSGEATERDVFECCRCSKKSYWYCNSRPDGRIGGNREHE